MLPVQRLRVEEKPPRGAAWHCMVSWFDNISFSLTMFLNHFFISWFHIYNFESHNPFRMWTIASSLNWYDSSLWDEYSSSSLHFLRTYELLHLQQNTLFHHAPGVAALYSPYVMRFSMVWGELQSRHVAQNTLESCSYSLKVYHI